RLEADRIAARLRDAEVLHEPADAAREVAEPAPAGDRPGVGDVGDVHVARAEAAALPATRQAVVAGVAAVAPGAAQQDAPGRPGEAVRLLRRRVGRLGRHIRQLVAAGTGRLRRR